MDVLSLILAVALGIGAVFSESNGPRTGLIVGAVVCAALVLASLLCKGCQLMSTLFLGKLVKVAGPQVRKHLVDKVTRANLVVRFTNNVVVIVRLPSSATGGKTRNYHSDVLDAGTDGIVFAWRPAGEQRLGLGIESGASDLFDLAEFGGDAAFLVTVVPKWYFLSLGAFVYKVAPDGAGLLVTE